MIFPLDVNRVVVDSKKVAGQNKVQAIIIAFILGGVALFFGTDYLLTTYLGTTLAVTIVVDAVILCIIAVLVFRFGIFDEEMKKKEYEGGESDSFAKYMWLRKDIHTDTKLGDSAVSIYEYVNGSAMCVMELRFGSNDDSKAEYTERLYEQLVHIAVDNGLEFRFEIGPEDFRNSTEFKRHIESINKIENKDDARTVMMIDNAIIDESCATCNVDIIYFMMRTLNNYQRADLEIALRQIFGLINRNLSAFRSISFLNPEQLMEFFRWFYNIAAIDLSMMKTIELSEGTLNEFDNIVTLLRVKAASGKVYETDNEVLVLKEKQIK